MVVSHMWVLGMEPRPLEKRRVLLASDPAPEIYRPFSMRLSSENNLHFTFLCSFFWFCNKDYCERTKWEKFPIFTFTARLGNSL